MAYHDDKTGYTPIIVGREYTRWLKYPDAYKLLRVNEATGYCVLRYPGGVLFVSMTELSKWHILPEGK
jgi:hypothetical protein